MTQRSGGTLVLLLSIIAGLAAALLAVSFLRGAARTQPVLVAVSDVAPFTTLSPVLFETRQLPQSAIPADAIRDKALLTGRYARTLLLAGTVVREGHLATATGPSGSLAARLTETGQPGTRALAVPIDGVTGVGGTVQPGDRVDVIAAVRVERPDGPAVMFARQIVSGVMVLHRMDGENGAKGAVVLQVTPQQGEEIAFAQLAGTIYLATNPYSADGGHGGTPSTTGVTADTFLNRYGGR